MALNPLLIDYLRAIISVGMLGYASFKDLRTREIHDYVWLFPALGGASLMVYEVFVGSLTLVNVSVSVGFMLILSGLLWYLQLFGGADLIAFVTLSAIHPRTPLFNFIGYRPIIFSFTLIANSALAGLFAAVYTFASNILTSRSKPLFEDYQRTPFITKIGLMFSGEYKSLGSIRGPPFEYPLEHEGKLFLRPDIWNDDKAEAAFRSLKEKGKENMWISATLPYIVVLLVGYLVSVSYGDVLFTLMAALSG